MGAPSRGIPNGEADLRRQEAKKVNVFGADVYLTMPRAAGRTEVSLLDATAHPGDGPPLHVHHNEDEISRVLKGRFRLRISEETVEPGPGGTLVMPHCYGSGVVHAAERCQEPSRRLTASPAERPDPETLTARRTALTPRPRAPRSGRYAAASRWLQLFRLQASTVRSPSCS